MTFTDKFNQLSREERLEAVNVERLRRLSLALGSYIPIPVAVPKPSQVIVAGATNLEIALGWIIATPGIPQAGPGERVGLSIGLPREDVAEDFCACLNEVRFRPRATPVWQETSWQSSATDSLNS